MNEDNENEIDWDKNFFVYAITATTFYRHQDEAYKLTEELQNLKEATWYINNLSTAQVGDYFLIKVTDDRTSEILKNTKSLISGKKEKNAILSLAHIKAINDTKISFDIVENFYEFPITDKYFLGLSSMNPDQSKSLSIFKELDLFQAHYREFKFKKWLKNIRPTVIVPYTTRLRETITEHLNSIEESPYDNLFACTDIQYLDKLHKRFKKKGGDLHQFNLDTQQMPSPAVKNYIKFLQEDNSIDIEIKNDSSNETNEPTNNEDEASKPIQNQTKATITQHTFSSELMGKLDFPYKNILFKGVPGTGKSRAIDTIIKKELKIQDEKKNILRVNIHSASSNSDLMQGIAITTEDKQVAYKEKQGLIFKHIQKACFSPYQPFVLVLEEIQENSLNELIGDLIYLIEDNKRAKIQEIDKSIFKDSEYEYSELIKIHLANVKNPHFVEIPNLVSINEKNRKMIIPDNLYIFCTSNYRDDKKVIEDNLLRRFEVIEIYPNNKVAHEYVKDFFTSLNDSILKVMQENHETHPDRFIIGHSIWKDVKDKDTFYKAFSKLITEFKDIREVEFDIFKEILKACTIPDEVDINIESKNNYFELIKDLQVKIDYGFLN